MRQRDAVIALGTAGALAGAGYLTWQYLQQQRWNPLGPVVQLQSLGEQPFTPLSTQNAPGAVSTAAAGASIAKATASGAATAGKGAKAVQQNEKLLTKQELALIQQLLQEGQDHLFASWPAPGSQDADKRRMVAQLVALDSSYPGGVVAYIRNAKQLLADSKEGRNPFDGYTPSVPDGAKLDFGSQHFLDMEEKGLKAAGAAAFVLVAGGLGERLGYSGIKVALPAESATGTTFLELYIRHILALQERAGAGKQLPFAIMTSGDTHERTEALLKQHNYFGMKASQVTLMKQEKVACLTDNAAHLALDPSDSYTLQTKPHGHGDVHSILHSTGLAKQWAAQGLQWVCFFQDTNALVFRGLTAALGVSAVNNYDVNSLAVPRKAKEAIGAICTLKHGSTGKTMTINVEYNQLDPLLRSTINPEGDVNDKTGYSPFPGNINQLVLKLSSYAAQLESTRGSIPEFVNPKYKDASKEAFKSATRLECMMQDYPKALGPDAKVGFTVVNQVWASYSPVKNSAADALAKFKEGNPTHSATTGELDIYEANCRILQQQASIQLPKPAIVTFNGLKLPMPPRVVLSPSFAPLLSDVKAKVSLCSIELDTTATLIIDGPDIHITGPLHVTGALVIKAVPGAKVVIGALRVANAGWEWQPLAEGEAAKEEEKIRGFRVVRKGVMELTFDTPGEHHYPPHVSTGIPDNDEDASSTVVTDEARQAVRNVVEAAFSHVPA